MGLYEFFFPQLAQAEHLRAMREMQEDEQWNQRREHRKEMVTIEALKQRIDDLENDLGLTVLVLTSLLATLDVKNVLKREDVEVALRKLDLLDGKKDLKISTEMLRRFFRDKDCS